MKSKICPKCGSSDISMIVYGLVDDIPSKEELQKKKIKLGGCIVSSDSTKWECDDCVHRWETVY